VDEVVVGIRRVVPPDLPYEVGKYIYRHLRSQQGFVMKHPPLECKRTCPQRLMNEYLEQLKQLQLGVKDLKDERFERVFGTFERVELPTLECTCVL
jgi:hypothetical protein